MNNVIQFPDKENRIFKLDLGAEFYEEGEYDNLTIEEIKEGGIADLMALKCEDQILSIDGKKVKTVNHIKGALKGKRGQWFELEIYRPDDDDTYFGKAKLPENSDDDIDTTLYTEDAEVINMNDFKHLKNNRRQRIFAKMKAESHISIEELRENIVNFSKRNKEKQKERAQHTQEQVNDMNKNK